MKNVNLNVYKEVHMSMNQRQTPLKEFPITENMCDSTIQQAVNSLLMSESQVKLLRYVLFDEDAPVEGKKSLQCEVQKNEDIFYIFHVLLDNNDPATFLSRFKGGKWTEGKVPFDGIKAYPTKEERGIFLYFGVS